MTTMRTICLAVTSLFVACGAPENGMPGTSVKPTCTVTASTMFQTGSPVTGSGSVSCDASGQISLKACLFMKNPSDTDWGAAVMCGTRDTSASSANTSVQVGVGFSTKQYRTVVEASINGMALTTQTSSPVTAP